MRKLIIYISIIWIILISVDILLEHNEIHSRFLFIENVMKLLTFFVWIVPILLIFLIKKKIVKYILLSISAIVILINSYFILFLGMFFINDLFIGNGYRQIFEKKISGNKFFSIYRSPDEGALGGDYRTYTVDTKYIFGIVKRHELSSNEYSLQQDIKNNCETIIIGNDTIFVDNTLIEKKGNLK